jgi:transposase-like protein
MEKQCPKCGSTERQINFGKTPAGSQTKKCMSCKKRYTPEPKRIGYEDDVKEMALKMYTEGINLRRIARLLGTVHGTIANWVKEKSDKITDIPVPKVVVTAEFDELFTYIGDKKTEFTP